jgi:hypothetical protein
VTEEAVTSKEALTAQQSRDVGDLQLRWPVWQVACMKKLDYERTKSVSYQRCFP